MQRISWSWIPLCVAVGIFVGSARPAQAACCYFAAKNADIEQPSQKVFLTWNPKKHIETFTVQPKFQGNALDFGMVIPTPSQPKLHEMPRDFFQHLAIYTILTKPKFPYSKLTRQFWSKYRGGFLLGGGGSIKAPKMAYESLVRKPEIEVLEEGIVGSLDYKIIKAGRADDLYKWLKKNRYHYSGDEATLNFYVQKKWLFTVMKIDTMQMKKTKDGTYRGEITPTRFTFTSEKLIYPLKITQLSVKKQTEALFYVQAPTKMDLQGTNSYQHTWIPMLQAASGCMPQGIPGRGGDWLAAVKDQIPGLVQLNDKLGFRYFPGQRPRPNRKGHIPTTMEWAKKLTKRDIDVLTGKAPYSEKVPDVDRGFTQADVQNPKTRGKVLDTIRKRLAECAKTHPHGYQVREAPKKDIQELRHLAGHLQAGSWIIKFRKIFQKDEMNDDLTLVPAKLGGQKDTSEYTQTLPVSPP
ncbi:MAG: DUF2330 domain-containing protein [Gemmataceae bacterium]